MSTEKKILIGGIFLTVIIIFIGGSFISGQEERLTKELVGQEIVVGRGHVPNGSKIDYNSDPPAGGEHYATTQPAGNYDKAPPDGNLVHSLEHGAVILWYNPDKIKGSELEALKKVFSSASGKRIMTPRENMQSPVAVSSWGRVLKLEKIDEAKILDFFDTNRDRAPENAPI